MFTCGLEIGLRVQNRVGINSASGFCVGTDAVEYIQAEVYRKVATFADDTKLFRMVKNKAACKELLKYLAKLSEWTTEWWMEFDVDKCKMMHMGKHYSKIYT